MTDTNTQEVLRRLKELEEENARLRSMTNDREPKPLTVKEGDYKGHPVLTFEGPCRPFSMGLRKLAIIKQAWPQVNEFLNRHENKSQAETHFDDVKI